MLYGKPWIGLIHLIFMKIPREMNGLADKLVVATSTLHPSDKMINGNGKMEINFRPSILDNVDH